MAVPKELIELVKRFGDNLEAYKSGKYNETQLRLEFIDPMFKVLGWDINNEQGYAEAYKDVIHEDALKIGTLTKAPDYCFCIGGARKFFLEAKKPSVNLKDDISPAFQLRRYAWSAKLPLSILTDFEEFAVYDCRVKPVHTDKASTARLFYFNFQEYSDRWDEIASIFSRDAVLRGSFDKYAETTKGKKGTAEVDTAFLKEIESWRELLAKSIALRNPSLTQRDLNYAVQSTIDRLIFLRICEDRGIESYGALQALQNGTNTYKRLCHLFRNADDRYNSGLFHFRAEKDRPEPPDELTLRLAIDERPLKDIIKRLYYPESPYEFSVLPADILGQVYEQFLGKVIRLTAGHHAVVEDKPEVKKAGGVYYTPTYIVDYIVKHTVDKLVEGKTPKQVAKLRILDPACGSGSFLIGAYQYLLDWHRDWYVNDGQKKWAVGKKATIFQTHGSEWRLTTAEKKRILLNNIYGVDIDSSAVEVTKLNLLLKVLEGENEETLNQTMKLWHERALPDLGNNIKCGNSLIGPDFYDTSQLSLLDDEDRYRINVFDWEKEFTQIFSTHEYSSSDPAELRRGSREGNRVQGGFDAVIGNPPYGAYLYDDDKTYLLGKFTNQSYQLDSYLLFLECAVKDLLARNGFYGMIIPNPWLTNLLQQNIRRFIFNKTRVHEIVHFKFPVFPKAVVDIEVIILQKENPENWQAIVTIVDSLEAFLATPRNSGILQIIHDQQKWRNLNGSVVNIFLSPAEESLAEKCLSKSKLLGILCEINVGIKPYQTGKGKPPQTKEVVVKRPYDSDQKLDASYRPYLRGSDIARFIIAPLKPRYLKYGSWLAEPRPAADFDAPVKIFMRQTGDSLVAALDTNRYLCLNNMHVLVPIDPQLAAIYLLGIINSKLLNWYYRTLNPEAGEALAEVKKTNVAKLPIRAIDFSDSADKKRHDRLVDLVNKMIELNKQLAAAKTAQDKNVIDRQIAATDQQIDKIVYELYGLTDKEIKIINKSI